MDVDLQDLITSDSLSDRYNIVQKDIATYRNCAGFVKYMLGLSEEETLVSPNDLSDKGILKYLDLVSNIDIQSSSNTLDQEKYIEKAKNADVVAILVNYKPDKDTHDFKNLVNRNLAGWRYVHFALIDPDNRSKVYQRPDIEKKPLHNGWRDFVKYADEFTSMERFLVFLKLKKK